MSKDTISIPIGFKVDSLKIIIPLNQISINNAYNDLLVTHVVDKENEIESIQKRNMLKTTYRNVDFYTAKVIYFGKEFFTILLNAKMLFEDYFKGITIYTIGQAFKNLQNQNHFLLKEDFLIFSTITDIDLCIDFDSTSEKLDCYVSDFKNVSENVFFKKFFIDKAKTKLSGFQFMTRKSAKVSKPYSKLYSKYAELTSEKRKHVYLFYKENFPNINMESALKNVWRFETTIKDRSFFHKINDLTDSNYSNNINDLLLFIDSLDLNIYLNYLETIYFNVPVIKNISPRLNSSEFFCQLYIKKILESNYDNGLTELYNEFNILLKTYAPKRSQKNTRTRISDIFKEELQRQISLITADYNVTQLTKEQLAAIPLYELLKLDKTIFSKY